MAFRKYTDEEQAMFVLQLEVLGYPDNVHAPYQVAKKKGAPSARTLRRWWGIKDNPQIDKLVQHKKIDLITELKDLLGLHIGASTKAVAGSEDLKGINTGIGILVDKILLLSGEPTDRKEVNITDNRSRVMANLAGESSGYVPGAAPKLGQGPNGRGISSG